MTEIRPEKWIDPSPSSATEQHQNAAPAKPHGQHHQFKLLASFALAAALGVSIWVGYAAPEGQGLSVGATLFSALLVAMFTGVLTFYQGAQLEELRRTITTSQRPWIVVARVIPGCYFSESMRELDRPTNGTQVLVRADVKNCGSVPPTRCRVTLAWRLLSPNGAIRCQGSTTEGLSLIPGQGESIFNKGEAVRCADEMRLNALDDPRTDRLFVHVSVEYWDHHGARHETEVDRLWDPQGATSTPKLGAFVPHETHDRLT